MTARVPGSHRDERPDEDPEPYYGPGTYVPTEQEAEKDNQGRHRVNRRIKLTVVGVAALLLLAGCGDKYQEGFKDAPRSGDSNTVAADTITFPDGFSNAATKCDHGNRVYVLFHQDSPYGGIAVVPADPTCK